jgi:hypothetical protein
VFFSVSAGAYPWGQNSKAELHIPNSRLAASGR